ncbi:hypothetical protein ACCT07_02945 [Rhizobium johnstonii]|uniref:hypothetical protein n=1 Tax=Rhizobium johnstonii TaxID=3019933 RepID=UPI003F9CE885
MPLIAISADIVETPAALAWQMTTSSGEQVQVIAGRSVLRALDPSKASDLAIFKQTRSQLEQIASLKFDAEGADPLGNVQIFKEDL